VINDSHVSVAHVKHIRTARDLARFCALSADSKKGTDIVAIDISQIDGSPAEWFVIVTCSSDQQIRAVAEHIEKETARYGIASPRSEGWEALQWVILDYFDVVVHLMRPEARAFYKLENLWGDGHFYRLSADGRLVRSTVRT
jgi:ribosome-associated protein